MNSQPDAHLSNSEIDRLEENAAEIRELEAFQALLTIIFGAVISGIESRHASSLAVAPLESLAADLEGARNRFTDEINQARERA